jgi:hypothetical protein
MVLLDDNPAGSCSRNIMYAREAEGKRTTERQFG